LIIGLDVGLTKLSVFLGFICWPSYLFPWIPPLGVQVSLEAFLISMRSALRSASMCRKQSPYPFDNLTEPLLVFRCGNVIFSWNRKLCSSILNQINALYYHFCFSPLTLLVHDVLVNLLLLCVFP